MRRFIGIAARIDEITSVNRYGAVFRLRLSDYIDSIVLREGYYESEVLEAMQGATPTDGVVWDVGANFGLHSVTLKKLRPDARVICFEPSPDQAARLLTHADMNNVELELYCMGLGKQPATGTLHTVRGNPGMNTFSPWSEATYTGSLRSYADTGDNLLRSGSVAKPAVIKLDVEGSELNALEGMSSLIGALKPTILCEGGPELLGIFDRLNMSCRPLVRNEATTHGLNNYIAEPL